MKKILHYGLSDSLGGIETYLFKISQHIDKKKYKFAFLIIGDKKPCFYKELRELGCEFYFITPRSKNYHQNIKELNKLFKTIDFDVLHCHLNSLSYITPIKIALKYGKKVIVHSRNAGCSASHVSKVLHQINYYRLPKKKVTLLAVSELAGKWMFGNRTNFNIINNGLDLKMYRFSEVNRVKIREQLGISDDYVIVHTGAFRTQKNHNFIIDIFKKVIEKRPKSKLVLVGDGALKKQIETKVLTLRLENNVIFLGIRNDIPAILSAADCFLFPSFYEGFPNAVIEAETSGLMCVISDEITKNVVIPQLSKCIPLSLNAEVWAKELLSMKTNINRFMGYELVKQKGLSIEDEILKLSNTYDALEF